MSSTKSYLEPDPTLSVGSTHAGFTVQSIEPIQELSGTAYIFKHDATGARLMWLATADTNKSFAIGFKTPPKDSTGVFHILEHSVLDGSDKYPVKEPFVNLLKTSMQTFLNALTFPDKTVYPVSSTNEKDLENLMDVYLDAVLHPAIYHRPRIFEQEGWHYEMADKDAPLTYNGVVFNEMKGALSDPDEVLYQKLQSTLFPDNGYAYVSGGDPRVIPTLTYQQFLNTHARHYQLSNSYTILYGAIDIERELAFIGKRFDEATDRKAGDPNPLKLQKPLVVKEPVKVEMATAQKNASAALSYVIGSSCDREKVLAVDILLDTLAGSNEAPLKRAVMDADLADDFQAQLLDGIQQPLAFFELKGLQEGAAAKFRPFLEEQCTKLVEQGLDHDKLKASLAQAEFNLREGDWSISDGVALSIQALSGWLYNEDNATLYLHYADALKHMREGLDNGYFEDLLRELILDSKHTAAVELIPTEASTQSEETKVLAERKAQLSDEEINKVIQEAQALHQEQATPDSPEDLAKLPQLHVSDITDAPAEPTTTDLSTPIPCWFHEMDTHGIGYVYYYFDLKRIGFEEMPYVSLLTDLLGNLRTQHHTASELDTLTETKLGSFDVFYDNYGQDNDLTVVNPKLVVAASALSDNVESLASIPEEIWGETLFDANLDRIYEILQQRRLSLERGFVNSGHTAAMNAAAAQLTPGARLNAKLSGVEFYEFLKKLLDRWRYRKQPTTEVLYNLASRIFTKEGTIVSFTGSKEDCSRFWRAAGDLNLKEKGTDYISATRLKIPEVTPKDQAFIIPSKVNYVAEVSLPAPHDSTVPGTWQVATRPLTYSYLWNEVRVKGGAYGVDIRHQANGMTENTSFRDPSIDATMRRYEQEGTWLANWKARPNELDGYIVSTVAGLDAPKKPKAKARLQDALRFQGRPADYIQKLRRQVLNTTEEDIRALAPFLDYANKHHVTCVFGSAEAIKASKHDFEIHELMEEKK